MEISEIPEFSVSGSMLKIAAVKEEEWLPAESLPDLKDAFAAFQKSKLKADLFTMAQKLPAVEPRFPDIKMEWDNVAAIQTSDYQGWWEQILPQEFRKNVRRSAKRGVVVRACELDDPFIKGVQEIYNETPVRQGKRFTHYGKDFLTIKREISSLPDRSQFIGAFYGEELIGFIKLVHMGSLSGILHIVSKNSHYDKRPSNALIEHAVALCHKGGVQFLVYGKYTYGKKKDNHLTEFKRRSGFQKILVPTYYVPLTLKGRVALCLGFHRGILGILPTPVISLLLKLRARCVDLRSRLLPPKAPIAEVQLSG